MAVYKQTQARHGCLLETDPLKHVLAWS